MKQFLFLYPIPEIISFEINKGMYSFRDQKKDQEFLGRLNEAKLEVEKEAIRQKALQAARSEFRTVYRATLNACIDARYRKKGFNITYAVFDASPVSDVIELQPSDRIIEVGLNFQTHTTQQPDGEYPYPNSDYILDQVESTKVLRVAGFHLWDCVDRIARRAYERGLEVLVDEDLTELFPGRIRNPEFKINTYPSYNPRKDQGTIRKMFLEARKERPWLWQE